MEDGVADDFGLAASPMADVDLQRPVLPSHYSVGDGRVEGRWAVLMHVALEVAAIAERVGFRTVVLDDRAEFANRERFPHSEVIVLESFDALPELLIDDNSYIVIVTRGHLNDGRMLEFALNTDAGYIGMIGSRIKRDLLYKNLMENGYEAGALAAVHSPIGLNIGAETPAEIAVSIVAELIAVRAGKERNG